MNIKGEFECGYRDSQLISFKDFKQEAQRFTENQYKDLDFFTVFEKIFERFNSEEMK